MITFHEFLENLDLDSFKKSLLDDLGYSDEIKHDSEGKFTAKPRVGAEIRWLSPNAERTFYTTEPEMIDVGGKPVPAMGRGVVVSVDNIKNIANVSSDKNDEVYPVPFSWLYI